MVPIPLYFFFANFFFFLSAFFANGELTKIRCYQSNNLHLEFSMDFSVCHKHMLYKMPLQLPSLYRDLCHIICHANALPIRIPFLTRQKYVFDSLEL